MKTNEAIEICEGWFAYLERQKAKSKRMLELAAMSRSGQEEEARRILRQMDNSVTVYDGATLFPAVQHLVKMARKAAGE